MWVWPSTISQLFCLIFFDWDVAYISWHVFDILFVVLGFPFFYPVHEFELGWRQVLVTSGVSMIIVKFSNFSRVTSSVTFLKHNIEWYVFRPLCLLSVKLTGGCTEAVGACCEKHLSSKLVCNWRFQSLFLIQSIKQSASRTRVFLIFKV